MKREIHLYKLENEYLKDQIYKFNGGKPIQMPSTQQLEQVYKVSDTIGSPLSGSATDGFLPPIMGSHQQQIMPTQQLNYASSPMLSHQPSYSLEPF